MQNDLKLNPSFSINIPKLIDSRLLIQANSGGGKSWLLRRILEQSHGAVQQIIIDPEGEFASLREKFDYVLAGKEGDTPAEPRSAALLARRLLELNVSAIIDLYELHPQERKRFVKLFLDAMINSPKNLHHPCIVVLDEAHMFAPEKGSSEALDAVISLASLGRKRGFCAVLATQRISKLHKDAAAECNNKLIGRTGLDIDRKRAAEELGFTSKEEVLSLRNLDPGEFYAFGPAISNEVVKVKVGDVRTTHPKAGARFKTKAIPPTNKIKALLPKLSDLPKEAEQEAVTVSELNRKIVTLQQENRRLSQIKPVSAVTKKEADPHIVEKAVSQALDKQAREFEKERSQWRRLVSWFDSGIVKIADIFASSKRPEVTPIELKSTSLKTTRHPVIAVSPEDWGKRPTVKPSQDGENEISATDITGPEQRILDAVAWANNIGIEQADNSIIAFLSGYTNPRSSGYTNPRGSLTSKGLVFYPIPGTVALTEEGNSAAQHPQAAGSEEELQSRILSRLTGPQSRILKVLIDARGDAINNEELAAAAGYSNPRSSGYTNPRGELRSYGLIDYPRSGMVQAKGLLFIN